MAAQIKKKRFENAVLFTMTISAWRNHRRVDTKDLIADKEVDKKAFRTVKELIKSDEYNDLMSYMGETKNQVSRRSAPFVKDGFYVVNVQMVEEIEKLLADRQQGTKDKVKALQAVYPQQVEDAKKPDRLGKFFDQKNYPDVKLLPNLFNYEWQWVAMDVPDNLPASVAPEAKKRIEAMWKEAEDTVIQALRGAFKGLVDHAVEKLTVSGSEKPKVFRDSMVEKMNEFLETFNRRKIMGDAELEKLIKQAKEVFGTVSAPELRTNDELRKNIAGEFSKIKGSLDKMIQTKGIRKFNVDPNAK